MKSNSSSHKQLVKTRLKNQLLRGKNNFGKSKKTGSTRGTILNEAKFWRIYKDWRKRYVVLHTWNQGKCTNTSRTGSRHNLGRPKTQILGQPYDEVLLTTDKRIKNYKENEYRIIRKDGLLFRSYYGETGKIKYYQILIPKQLVDEVFRSLHGEIGKHPGITKTINAYRQMYYYPNIKQNWSDRGSHRVSNALENHQSTIGLHDQPCRIPVNRSHYQKTPCKSICFRNNLHLVALKT